MPLADRSEKKLRGLRLFDEVECLSQKGDRIVDAMLLYVLADASSEGACPGHAMKQIHNVL